MTTVRFLLLFLLFLLFLPGCESIPKKTIQELIALHYPTAERRRSMERAYNKDIRRWVDKARREREQAAGQNPS